MLAAPFKRILIANRGEIAVRVIRACQQLGIETVAAVSDADRDSLAAKMATRAVCIGPASASQSYLQPELLVTAAVGTNCEAIHPGYGFLSERAQFSRMCATAGLTFIGPAPEAIEVMGDKLSAVQLAEKLGVPRVPGSGRVETGTSHVKLRVPMVSGAGQGQCWRRWARDARVRRDEEFISQLAAAAAEAQAAFGDPSLYVEKFIERARHIEIQIIGDSLGTSCIWASAIAPHSGGIRS